MIDTDNDIKWIPLTFLMFMVFLTISLLYVGSMRDISTNIEQYDRGKFRLAVVMENTLTVSSTPGEEEINYLNRRGAIPKKFFTNEIDGGETGKIGYAITEDNHCYIPRVAGLDGENFAFHLSTGVFAADEHVGRCQTYTTDNPAIDVPILMVDKSGKFHNEKREVELFIYEIK
jgi:hypothetical protein